jgi:hypothetical protein
LKARAYPRRKNARNRTVLAADTGVKSELGNLLGAIKKNNYFFGVGLLG